MSQARADASLAAAASVPGPDAAFIAALNHLLKNAAWARQRLQPYNGRSADMSMPPLALHFVIDADGYCRSADAAKTPDVHIRLPADAPLHLLQGGVDKLMSLAHVEGNAEFATELSFVLRRLRWDVGEDLSLVFGDIAAQRLLGAGRALGDWGARSLQRLAENGADFFIHESSLLASAADAAELAAALQQAHQRLDELELRAQRLQAQGSS